MTKKKRTTLEILNEIKVALGLAVMIIGFFVALYVRLAVMDEKLEVIQTNELVHIQAAIDENKMNIESGRITDIKILEALARVEALIEALHK